MDPILLVDDDSELCQMLAEYLQLEGFEVEQAQDGQSALALTAERPYAVIILDVMMPGLNGFDTLKALRQQPGAQSATPVLMMSARGEEVDRIVGLEIGADDYLPKPCSPRELLARIRAMIRRVSLEHQTHALEKTPSLQLGELSLDSLNQSAQLRQRPLALTQTEFRILHCLLRAPAQLVTKQALTRQALNRSLGPFDRSIDMHLSNLRRKLNQIAPNAILIQTVRGSGYRLLQGQGRFEQTPSGKSQPEQSSPDA
ncbi:MAG: DNA-binding response OmpR family regulator [Motiliproteus sp.]|jgi:DNA-binding response OmpR family regulator